MSKSENCCSILWLDIFQNIFIKVHKKLIANISYFLKSYILHSILSSRSYKFLFYLKFSDKNTLLTYNSL